MCKILVVDDEPVNLFLYKEFLERAGYGVVMSTNGMNVEGLILSEKPSLILLDVKLPVKDGDEIYLDLKKRNPGIFDRLPVFFISAHCNIREIVSKTGVAVDDILYKPIDFRHLLGKIKKVCTIENQLC